MKQSKLAKIFKALSCEQRLSLFSMLYSWSKEGTGEKVQDDKSCCEIDKAFSKACEYLNISKSTISHHFKELQNAGLISCTRTGQSQCCSINIDSLNLIREFLL